MSIRPETVIVAQQQAAKLRGFRRLVGSPFARRLQGQRFTFCLGKKLVRQTPGLCKAILTRWAVISMPAHVFGSYSGSHGLRGWGRGDSKHKKPENQNKKRLLKITDLERQTINSHEIGTREWTVLSVHIARHKQYEASTRIYIMWVMSLDSCSMLG